MHCNSVRAEQESWTSPVYGFYNEQVTIEYVKNCIAHVFTCCAQGCATTVWHYQDKRDASSTGNMYKHAKSCWGEETVAQARALGNLGQVRSCIVAGLRKNGNITEYFRMKKMASKPTYLHRQMSREQTR